MDRTRRSPAPKTSRVVLLLLAGMVVSMAAAADPPTVDPEDPRLNPNVADPNDPSKERGTVSHEQREQLGLVTKTWPGIVDPNVYAALDNIEATAARLKEKAAGRPDTRTIDALWRIRFEGTVYVQVQLIPSTKQDTETGERTTPIQTQQKRVLSRLSAAQFHLSHLFSTALGFTGYVTRQGLEKLAQDSEVAGVCLDNEPLAEGGVVKILVKESLPPAKPGEAAEEPGVKEGVVDPDAYRAFEVTDRVRVEIALRSDDLPKLTDQPKELAGALERRRAAERILQDRVLSSVTADDFWVVARSGPGLSGLVTKEGLRKLARHPDISRIGLPHMVRPAMGAGAN